MEQCFFSSFWAQASEFLDVHICHLHIPNRGLCNQRESGDLNLEDFMEQGCYIVGA